MSKKGVSIKIKYTLIGEEEWHTIDIPPQDYFDLDEGEVIEVDSIPMYNHAIDYIKKDSNKVINTTIIIEGEGNKEKIVINESFWNKQQNRIIEKTYHGIDFREELVIVETKVKEEPVIYEITRAIRKDGILIPVYHGFITENDDGSQTEIKVIG